MALQEILGILSGRIDMDVQMQLGMLVSQLVENGLESPIAIDGFGEMERWGGSSFLFIEQRDVVSVASGVDPHTDVRASG
jgi:hypothetical protein